MYVASVGMIIVDVIAAELERIAKPGELVYTKRPTEYHQGGHPGNVVIDLNKLGIEREKLASISAVGSDAFGKFLIDTVSEYANVYYKVVEDKPTAIDLILVAKGEDRRFHVSPGALLSLDVEYVLRSLDKCKPKILDIRPGYSGIDARVREILEYAKQNYNSIVFLDICRPMKRPEVKGWNYVLDFIDLVNIVHCNEKELAKATGKADMNEGARMLLDRGVKLALITHGPEGLTAYTKDFVLKQPAYKVNVVDPTGAGDAFMAGFEYRMIKQSYEPWNLGKDELIDMLAFAQACGAACVQYVGCTTGVNRENVGRIYRERGNEIKRNSKVL